MGGDYVLNGTKIFITSGGEAELYLVFAVTDPASVRKKYIGVHCRERYAGIYDWKR
ncbi:hypothetical protein BsIDN1_65350 [Bacillus safensis]|uniref:Acyl-CoA oxidase/dehydrogenase middle domain-containing protein n=1 Tax=Bacillus safensis TaxID=561879 RepID=A0A5S9MHG5_BACIA|nr:hypothetical protein BsIDN1_65350 [Bacillus safensis]